VTTALIATGLIYPLSKIIRRRQIYGHQGGAFPAGRETPRRSLKCRECECIYPVGVYRDDECPIGTLY
jgi:hypothetical protein